jgi:hypothetical protein
MFLVDQDIPLLVEDADIEVAGVQVAAAVMGVGLGVEFHRGLLLRRSVHVTSRMGRVIPPKPEIAGGGLNEYQGAAVGRGLARVPLLGVPSAPLSLVVGP